MSRTLIGVPTSGTINAKTAFSLFNLEGDADLVMQFGCDVASNRNEIVNQTLNSGAEYLLFVDADMVFNPDTLTRMLSHGKDMVGLLCNKRTFPLVSNVAPLDEDRTKPIPKTLFKAGSCGTGVMLIKTEVFKKLSFPWFEFRYEGNEHIGEDVNFCRNARKIGYDIWVDPEIPVRHAGEFLY